MVTLYGIKNCDTIKKARRWLEANNIDYRFHDYRVDGLDSALMTEMPAIIKRPLLCAPGKPMLLGFSDSSYQQFFHEV